MKKVITILAASFLAIGAQAQWGITAGLTFTNVRLSEVRASEKFFDSATGYLAGLTYDIDLIGGLGLNTGLLFVQRNVRENDAPQGGSRYFNRYSSLELPLNARYEFLRLMPAVSPFLTAGFRFDCGLWARERGERAKFRDGLNRFGSGFMIGAGVDVLSRVRLMYQYDLGISNATSWSWENNDVKVRHRGNRISAALLF